MPKQLSRAVQERRAPAIVEADDATREEWRRYDYFASPPWSVRAGVELLLQVDEGAGCCGEEIWEPACGDGIMARVLGETFKNVKATDIAPRGPFRDFGSVDFLADDTGRAGVGWVFTNPPFQKAVQFVEKGLKVCARQGGVMILCRLSFLESAERYPLLSEYLTDVAVFSERVPMQLGPWNPDCSTATAYAWFVFRPWGATSGYPNLRLIPPGTRRRLSQADDIARFCPPAAAPLLGSDTSVGG